MHVMRDEVSIINATRNCDSCEGCTRREWLRITNVQLVYYSPLQLIICYCNMVYLYTRRTYLIIGVRQDRTLSCRAGEDCERKELRHQIDY